MPFTRQFSMRPLKSSYYVFFLLTCITTVAHAASCSISTTAISFGSYDVFSNAPTDTTGSVTVNCAPVSTPYTIALESGLHGPMNNRAMQSAISNKKLRYNLYIDAAHSTIWGNGTANTAVVNGNTSATVNVYGRIPPEQNVDIGAYSDSVTVTVTF